VIYRHRSAPLPLFIIDYRSTISASHYTQPQMNVKATNAPEKANLITLIVYLHLLSLFDAV
jgi:hypothetical protein